MELQCGGPRLGGDGAEGVGVGGVDDVWRWRPLNCIRHCLLCCSGSSRKHDSGVTPRTVTCDTGVIFYSLINS